MLSLPVVKHLDVLEARCLHVVMRGIANAMHSLVLKAIEPTLRCCVIPAVSFATHRAGHAVRLEFALKGMAGVLATPVGMMHQARCRSFAEPGHGQRIRHDIRRHARFLRPADDFAIEQIENDGQIQPAFVRPQVGDVRRPDLIRCRRREVSIQQIARYRQTVFRVRRHLVAPFVASLNPVLMHQSLHPLLAGRETPCPQLSNHARAAVSVFKFGMNRADERKHLAVRQSLAIRRAAARPRTVAADTDIEGFTYFRQNKRLPLFGNPSVLHSASFAKYAPQEIPLGDAAAFL